MKYSAVDDSIERMLEEILGFIGRTKGLKSSKKGDSIEILQRVDSRSLSLSTSELSEVLVRLDGDGKEFLQVNFLDGRKLLITDTLVGFKPFSSLGLDMSKIPKVVTTPDLMSVLEAIEDSMSAELPQEQEIEVLKKVFNSILHGGELIGFSLCNERQWLDRLITSNFRVSA